MNHKSFMQKTDEKLQKMNEQQLRDCLHETARKIPTTRREAFLQQLEDFTSDGNRKTDEEEIRLEKKLSDTYVETSWDDMQNVFAEIENGDMVLTAKSYQVESENYFSDDWAFDYEDEDGIGYEIARAVSFACACMYDCRYDIAAKVFDLVLNVTVTADEEYGDMFELGLVDMDEEHLINIDLKALACNILYVNYQSQPIHNRAKVLYSYFERKIFHNIQLEDILSVGRQELKDSDLFFESWIEFLTEQSGDQAARLLNEALIFHQGTTGMLQEVRTIGIHHPSLYLTALAECEKTHDFKQMQQIGLEALKKLSVDLVIRGKIALLTSKASYRLQDDQTMRACWVEAFLSDPTVVNLLRLFVDKETFLQYKDQVEKRIDTVTVVDRPVIVSSDEMRQNGISTHDYRQCCFFLGLFDCVRRWCDEKKGPLGWSGEFIGYGVDLMLLVLYQKDTYKKALRKIVERVCRANGFDETKKLVFLKTKGEDALNVGEYSKEDIFWDIFCRWKAFFPIENESKCSYVDWLESTVRKRVHGVVQGQYRNKYWDVALLVAALGEVKESMGVVNAKMSVIDHYMKKYNRYSAFRRCLKSLQD